MQNFIAMQDLYRRKQILLDKKLKIQHETLYPQVGDIVLYNAKMTNGTPIGSGCGVVKKVIDVLKVQMQFMYVVIDNKTNKEVEVMSNNSSYPDDFIVTINTSTEYYSGYDRVSKKVIPNTVSMYKSDCEDIMKRTFGEQWRDDYSYYEVRKVQINILDE